MVVGFLSCGMHILNSIVGNQQLLYVLPGAETHRDSVHLSFPGRTSATSAVSQEFLPPQEPLCSFWVQLCPSQDLTVALKLQLCCAWRQPPSPPHPWEQLPPVPSPALSQWQGWREPPCLSGG